MPRTGENYTGPLISFVSHIRRHIRITDKWNLSFSCNTMLGCVSVPAARVNLNTDIGHCIQAVNEVDVRLVKTCLSENLDQMERTKTNLVQLKLTILTESRCDSEIDI